MPHHLLSPDLFPFAVAAGVLLGLVVIEMLSLVVGGGSLSSVAHALDGHFVAHAPIPHAHGGGHAASHPALRLIGWLNVGGAPFAAVIMSLLAGFTLSGAALVALCAGLGLSCPSLLSVPAATAAALVATRSITRVVGRLVPRDETYAIRPDALIGALAVVTVGPVRRGHRGRGRTRDPHGNWHYPLLEVAEEDASFRPGETVMLVAYGSGAFLVTAPDGRLLPQTRDIRSAP